MLQPIAAVTVGNVYNFVKESFIEVYLIFIIFISLESTSCYRRVSCHPKSYLNQEDKKNIIINHSHIKIFDIN